MASSAHIQVSAFPEPLARVFALLKEKESSGEFVFCTTFSAWSEAEDLLAPLNLGYSDYLYIRAAGLIYIIEQTKGFFSVPETENVWSWANSLSIIAPIAEWPPEVMTNVVSSFSTEKEDVDRLLGNAVTLYCKAFFDNGYTLLQSLPNYRAAIMAGLMEGDYSRYCELFPPDADTEEFSKSFLKANQIETSTVERVFETALSFQGFESSNAVELFLKAHNFLNDDKKVECEKMVLDILHSGGTHFFVPAVCNWLFVRKDVSAFDEECILALIEGLDEDHRNLLRTIDDVVSFRYEGKPEFFQRVALCIAETLNPADVLLMENMLHVFHKSEEPFQQLVFSFIMHTKGTYRMAGRRIWDAYHLESSSFDISGLEENIQCIFVMLMLEDYGNPETRLPKVLPLLKTGSTKVKSVLMMCLRPYLDDYMGHVINALDQLHIESPEATRIREYFKTRSELVQARRNLKELSPAIRDYTSYQEARKVERQHLQEQIKAAEANHKPTWMDLLSTVALARGGGFRDHNGKTQHLIPISHSAPAHMLMQAMSPQEQDDLVSKLLKDWNEDAAGNH